MTSTTISAERSFTYIFTTFTDVACHASLTCWRPVSRLSEMSSLSLICSSLSLTPTARSRNSSHFHVGPARQLCPLPPAPKPLLCPPLTLLRGVAATATHPRRLRHRERLCLAVGREGARAGRQHAGEGGRTAARRRGREGVEDGRGREGEEDHRGHGRSRAEPCRRTSSLPSLRRGGSAPPRPATPRPAPLLSTSSPPSLRHGSSGRQGQAPACARPPWTPPRTRGGATTRWRCAGEADSPL